MLQVLTCTRSLVWRLAASPLGFRSPPCLRAAAVKQHMSSKIALPEKKRERLCRHLRNEHIWRPHEPPREKLLKAIFLEVIIKILVTHYYRLWLTVQPFQSNKTRGLFARRRSWLADTSERAICRRPQHDYSLTINCSNSAECVVDTNSADVLWRESVAVKMEKSLVWIELPSRQYILVEPPYPKWLR